MKQKTVGILFLFISLLITTSCSHRSLNVISVPTINQAATLSSIELYNEIGGISKNILMTSLVNINNFKLSSDFGRLYSELMMTNFEKLGLNIVDYRGDSILAKNKEGEFYLNRDNIKDIPKNSLVYVGTYSEYKDGLLLNMRLLDYSTNRVIVSSSIHLNDTEALLLSRQRTRERLMNGFEISLKQDCFSETDKCKNSERK